MSLASPLSRPLEDPFGRGNRRGGTVSAVGAITTRTTGPAANEIEADGRQLLKADYSKLYAAIGDAYSVADFTAGFSAVTLPFAYSWNSIAFGNEVFVATAPNTINGARSVDFGATWQSFNFPLKQNWTAITFGNGVFVAVARGSAICATSPDGKVWTQQTLPDPLNWASVIYGNGLFVAVATTTATSASSPDGVVWTRRTMPSLQAWSYVGYGAGVFVALAGGGSGSSVAASSPDGIAWTLRALPSSAIWSSVVYGNGVFVAVSNDTVYPAVSSDGANWILGTQAMSGSGTLVFGQGWFVALGGSRRSANGLNWTVVAAPDLSYTSSAFGGGVLISSATGTSSAARANIISPTTFNLPKTTPLDNRSTAYIKVA